MNWFIILSLFCILNFQECHCCLKSKRSADYCECSDIIDLLDEYADRANIPITEKVGCVRNITCNADINTFAGFYFSASEIVRPDGNTDNIAYVDSINRQTGVPRGPLDIFSSFGMSCENKKWYVTKYPHGLSYYTKDSEEFISGDLDGKKSEIGKIFCKPPVI
ncbi:hypothetical protein CRE_21388 [Caenorhabditis remanei]|uniref:Uncharacterized protein n=1 Tax=Caenorhabditis remanei TaxID=31234 RepID=E3MUP4_CAERE|nr:hypothetical protein CRE_21388 [Caenorhabditis remanei]